MRPTTWSMSCSNTGSRVWRGSLKMRTTSRRSAFRSTATMSVRGTMISRTVLPPISMIPWIIGCSCSSMTPCSSETCRRLMSSSSVRYGARAARPPVIPREMNVTAHRIGPRKLASRSTGPAAASATRSACVMARVFGVTSAAISSTTESRNESSSVSHRRTSDGTPQRVNSDSLSRAVAVEATMRARVLMNSTVERKRFGSARKRCKMPAALLPCSARKRTRSRPTDVSAVSVPLARAATMKQTIRTISSNQSVALMAGGLPEELADAPVLVPPDDRLREQRCNRQHREGRAELVGGNRHRVGDYDLLDLGLLEPFDRVAGEDRVRGRDQHPAGTLGTQRLGQLGDRAAGGDDVLDHHAVPALYI